MLFENNYNLMSDRQPMISSSFSRSYLEDDGIYLGTKQNQRSTNSVRPPRIVTKVFNNSTPLYHLPKCVAGIEHFSGIFPSPLYDEQCNQTYLNQCFEIIHKIGEGSFGFVFKVRSKENNNYYAVKVFKEPFRNRNNRSELLEEVRRHEQLSKHPNIVTLYQAWEDEGYLHILLELCDMSLDAYTQAHHNISESTVWDILHDAVSAVKYIHSKNLIHMDIKLENILLASDGTYKLSDFGLVLDTRSSTNNKNALEGDAKYLAPEVMDGHFTQAADIFSLGIAVLEVAGDLVLPGGGEAWHHLRQGKIPHQQTANLSSELIEVITGMMHPDPYQRLNAAKILSTPTLQRRKQWRKLKIIYKKIKIYSKRVSSTIAFPFRKLLILWRRLKTILFGGRNTFYYNNNNKLSDSPVRSPRIGSNYAGIGHSTPICNGESDILNLSNFSRDSFTFGSSNLRSRQKRGILNKNNHLLARRKLSYNLSDSE